MAEKMQSRINCSTKFILIIILLFTYSCVYSETGYVSEIIMLNGTAHSDNISSYNLSYMRVGESGWSYIGFNISDGSSIVDFNILGAWDTSYVDDGEYVLKLNVTDNDQISSQDYVYVTVDNLQLLSPENETVCIFNQTIEFNGTAVGSQYGNYTITYSNQSKPYVWQSTGMTLVDSGYPNKTDGTLGYFNSSNIEQDNYYLFNISMPNNQGFNNEILLNLTFMSPDIYEPDDNYSLANLIQVNGSEHHHNFLPDYDVDFVKFNASSEYKYIIETHSADNGSSAETDTYMYLFDQDGETLLDIDDDGGIYSLSKMELIPDSNQTYYVAVDNYYWMSGGEYWITIQEYDKYYKGIIPNNYSYPFYTYSENPKTCSDVKNNGFCNMTWSVNNLADIGSEYDFFTIIEDNFNSIETNKTRITTENYPPPTVTIVYPENGSTIETNDDYKSIELQTDKAAYCYYSTSSDYDYYNYGFLFSTTGDTLHQKSIPVSPDVDYDYYYYCRSFEGYSYSISDRVHHHFRVEEDDNNTDNDDDDDDDDNTNNNNNDDDSTTTTSISGGAPVPVSTGGDSAKSSFFDLKNDSIAKMTITSEAIPIKKIFVYVNQDIVGLSSLIVIALDERPTQITAPTSKNVYKYLQIKTENLVNEAIDEVNIEFQISMDYLNENNYPKENVIMLRRDEVNNVWEELKTSYSDSDPEFAYYKATSYGFSYFAIGIDEVKEEEEVIIEINDTIENLTIINETEEPVQEITGDVVTETETSPAEESDEKEFPLKFVLISLFSLIILVFGGAVIYKNRESFAEIIASMKTKKEEQKKEEPSEDMVTKVTEIHEPEEHSYIPDNKDLPSPVTGIDFSGFHDPQLIMENMLDIILMYGFDNLIERFNKDYSIEEINSSIEKIRSIELYIREQHKKGHDIRRIKYALEMKGWKPAVVEKLIKLISKRPSSS